MVLPGHPVLSRGSIAHIHRRWSTGGTRAGLYPAHMRMSHAAASLQKLWGNRMTGVVRVKSRRGGARCGGTQRPGCEARL